MKTFQQFRQEEQGRGKIPTRNQRYIFSIYILKKYCILILKKKHLKDHTKVKFYNVLLNKSSHSIFAAEVSGNASAGYTANAIEYEEVSAKTSSVYEKATNPGEQHLYECLAEKKDKVYQNIAE